MAMDGDCGNTTNMTMESTMTTSASNRNDSSMWQPYERGNWPNGVLVLSTKRNPQLCFPVDDTRSLTQWCVSIIKQPESLHKPTGIQACIQSIRYAENQWLAPAITYTVKHACGQSIMHTTSQPVGHICMLQQSSIILQVAIHAVIHVHAHMQ